MEKKKLLLVAVSVGVFLVIAVSAAILVFRPGSGGVVTSNGSSLNTGYNLPGTADPIELTHDNSNRETLDGNPASTQGTTNNNDGNTVIVVPKPATTAVPEVAPAAKPAVKPVEQTKPAPVQAKPSAPAAPKTSSRDYWVQAGSFSTRERADGVKNTLGTKGLTAIITNQEINGNTYYRVRVGPYTSQNEADYWLAMIKSIDGFHESQIWESQSFR